MIPYVKTLGVPYWTSLPPHDPPPALGAEVARGALGRVLGPKLDIVLVPGLQAGEDGLYDAVLTHLAAGATRERARGPAARLGEVQVVQRLASSRVRIMPGLVAGCKMMLAALRRSHAHGFHPAPEDLPILGPGAERFSKAAERFSAARRQRAPAGRPPRPQLCHRAVGCLLRGSGSACSCAQQGRQRQGQGEGAATRHSTSVDFGAEGQGRAVVKSGGR